MANQIAFSIYDTKAEIFNPPFYQRNAGEAARSFSKIVNESNSLLNQYPEDYVLIQIGSFNDETGMLESCKPITIGTASQYTMHKKEN